MSGPPLPRQVPGSNAIGTFKIGISPIGAIEAFDVWNTIISQYANSPIITSIITDFAQSMDQTSNIEAFFELVINLDTAQGYGLDVWGRIVGVTRVLHVENAGDYFGFEEAGLSAFGFNQEPFYSGAPLTDNFELTDDAFRLLIIAKAASNITDGSVKSINALLMSLFVGRGNCYVIDGLDMSMQYHFDFDLTPVELAILGQSGVLPTPGGVSATITQTVF